MPESGGRVSFKARDVSVAFVQTFEALALQNRESGQSYRDTANQMDGPMQSRYDTQRTEHAMEAEMRNQTADNYSSLLESFGRESRQLRKGVIGNGSTIELSSDDYGSEWYFVSSLGSFGHPLNIQGVNVYGLNINSPLGNNLLGRKKGDRISIEVDEVLEEYIIMNVLN